MFFDHCPAVRAGASMSRVVLAVAALALSQPALAGEAKRIVSLGGSVTEILYALGVEDRIVGIDSTSLYPARALKTKANVGYLRSLSAEGVLALAPDAILAAEGAGPPAAVALLARADVHVTVFGDDPSPEALLRKVESLGAFVTRQDAAARLAENIRADFDRIREQRARIGRPHRAMLLLGFQNGRVMAAGRGTAADAVLRLAGLVNATGRMEGYKPLSDEAIVAAAPEVIILAVRSVDSSTDVFANPAFQATPAAAGKRQIDMDALYLLGFGPRTPQAILEVMNRAYPDLQGSP